jgi:cytochrome P450
MRRQSMMRLAAWLDLDRRAVERLERCRVEHGPGPVIVRVGGRTFAFLLDPQDVHRVLRETPYPFASATLEKRAALAHFEPENVLVSEGAVRGERRELNEFVLGAEHPVHRFASRFLEVIAAEADLLQERGLRDLVWREFSEMWSRVVLRVVFGASAREDDDLLNMMAALRRAANWAWLAPRQDRLLGRMLQRIRHYIDKAEPGSLAAIVREACPSSEAAPEYQIPQWLFAFDAAAMATFRALALLASNPEYARGVRQEVESGAGVGHMAMTRAAVLESLRLWPTTPLLLRETRETTEWETGTIPAYTGIIIFTPYFHRNRQVPEADTFAPNIWLKDAGLNQTPAAPWPLIPFSEGPGICPGRQIVLLLSTSTIAAILVRFRLRLKHPHPFRPDCLLPGTLNHFALSFELRRVNSRGPGQSESRAPAGAASMLTTA